MSNIGQEMNEIESLLVVFNEADLAEHIERLRELDQAEFDNHLPAFKEFCRRHTLSPTIDESKDAFIHLCDELVCVACGEFGVFHPEHDDGLPIPYEPQELVSECCNDSAQRPCDYDVGDL